MTNKSKLRRFLERCLLLAGLAGVGIWAWSNIRGIVYQDWDDWAFERKLDGGDPSVSEYLIARERQAADKIRGWLGGVQQPSEEQPRSIVRDGDLVGRLVIPRLNSRSIVREGRGESTLGLALGHIPGTALPGQPGNVGVAGHRDTFFRGLGRIAKKDVIEFQTLSGTYLYQVESTSIVSPKNVSVLDPGKSDELTLVTCYPFNYVGSAPERFIVKAQLLTKSEPKKEIAALMQSPDKKQNKLKHVKSTPPRESQKETSDESKLRPVKSPPRQEFQRETQDRLGVRKIPFQVGVNHSRQVTPLISVGLSGTDAVNGTARGWMWVMPDRRTIWLRDQATDVPLVFYSTCEGKRSALVLTNVSANSASGYLLTDGQLEERPCRPRSAGETALRGPY